MFSFILKNKIKENKQTNFIPTGLLIDEIPLSAPQYSAAPQFVAPRKLDFRDMCLASSNQSNTPHCFPSSTRVLMEDLSWMPICDIRPGMRVISSDGKPHTVIQNMKRQWQGTMKSIKATGFSEPIISTSEHPYMVIKRKTQGLKNKEEHRNIEWIQAKDIKNGDYIATIGTVLRSIDCEPIYGYEIDPDFLWMVGLYLAEGIMWDDKSDSKHRHRTQIGFCLHKKEICFANRLLSTASRYGFSGRIELRKNSQSQVVIINSYPWRKWLEYNCGRHSDKKMLSSRIMLMLPSMLKIILQGWIDGDGSLESKGRFIGTTTSIEMAHQMKLIAAKCGLISMMRKRKEREDRKPTWDVTIQMGPPGITTRGFAHNGLWFTPVTEIKHIKSFMGGCVYNIEVEETHDYIVDFAVVHNCVGYSTAGFIEIQNWKKNHYPEQVDGDAIYMKAKTLDNYSGPGTTLQAGAQAAIMLNLISGTPKRITASRDDIKFAIHQYGSCITAFLITNEWNNVGSDGLIPNLAPNVSNLGGHAVLCCGYSEEGVYIQNSWGSYWGLYGFCLLPWDLFDKQFKYGMVIV